MRISDCSSDVCSSDLRHLRDGDGRAGGLEASRQHRASRARQRTSIRKSTGDRPMAAALSEAELLALVDVLADGQWHSGEALAADAGITRAALSKRVERLRDWQLDVESRQGLGYRLTVPLERLDAHALQADRKSTRLNSSH